MPLFSKGLGDSGASVNAPNSPRFSRALCLCPSYRLSELRRTALPIVLRLLCARLSDSTRVSSFGPQTCYTQQGHSALTPVPRSQGDPNMEEPNVSSALRSMSCIVLVVVMSIMLFPLEGLVYALLTPGGLDNPEYGRPLGPITTVFVVLGVVNGVLAYRKARQVRRGVRAFSVQHSDELTRAKSIRTTYVWALSLGFGTAALLVVLLPFALSDSGSFSVAELTMSFLATAHALLYFYTSLALAFRYFKDKGWLKYLLNGMTVFLLGGIGVIIPPGMLGMLFGPYLAWRYFLEVRSATTQLGDEGAEDWAGSGQDGF